MREPTVDIAGLSKRYDLGPRREHGDGLRHALERAMRPSHWWRAARRRGAERTQEFWALRDVTVTIGAGEVVVIIGRNGAGKSTLLKILSRITEPTAGRVRLRGRVASLLEVATGFHPDLTGRENVYLNGAILGMTRREIRSKFDEIVAFAEVETFLDTPVKRYSSGMYVRLAFAVAAHLEPEILIVDEVLAVGDAAFQKSVSKRWTTSATQAARSCSSRTTCRRSPASRPVACCSSRDGCDWTVRRHASPARTSAPGSAPLPSANGPT
jgi:lipopolysaccharide transport system ATP-binding protein